jgi:hypothetical protein
MSSSLSQSGERQCRIACPVEDGLELVEEGHSIAICAASHLRQEHGSSAGIERTGRVQAVLVSSECAQALRSWVYGALKCSNSHSKLNPQPQVSNACAHRAVRQAALWPGYMMQTLSLHTRFTENPLKT